MSDYLQTNRLIQHDGKTDLHSPLHPGLLEISEIGKMIIR